MVETDYNSDERIKAYLHSRKDNLIESLKAFATKQKELLKFEQEEEEQQALDNIFHYSVKVCLKITLRNLKKKVFVSESWN